MSSRITHLIVFLLTQYQRIFRPFLGRRCRFYPSCSDYAREAFILYGFWKGSGLTWRRLFRCHPWHPGGHDPVP